MLQLPALYGYQESLGRKVRMAVPFIVMIDHKDIDLVFEMTGIVRMLLRDMFQSDHVVGITQKHRIGRICFNSDFQVYDPICYYFQFKWITFSRDPFTILA